MRAEIVALLVSPVHRLDGRPAPVDLPDETVDSLDIRAGLGIVGDRYFGRRAHRDASVTVMAAESLDPWGAGLARARRNVLFRGVDVDGGRGRILELDSGEGLVALRLHRPASPCAWMEHTVGPGAWRGLRRRGGMRAEPLTDGVLRVGPVRVTWRDSAT
ncbi:MAG TPA: hypothetical protein VGN18_16600 [Jatrophihabitans sp.]|jgi:hypothetical protein|uniref:hypothetical protein n=1 Tax=Jatrophihabitans sp. TaxID=1932789 RepID=UPI002DF8006B|nr:hypothetical protein [Jatrophihabitans sp.]